MSKHEAVTTHTFTTDEGIKIVIELTNERFSGVSIQFPGSGNRPIKLIPTELKELAAVSREAAEFLDPISPIKVVPDPETFTVLTPPATGTVAFTVPDDPNTIG